MGWKDIGFLKMSSTMKTTLVILFSILFRSILFSQISTDKLNCEFCRFELNYKKLSNEGIIDNDTLSLIVNSNGKEIIYITNEKKSKERKIQTFHNYKQQINLETPFDTTLFLHYYIQTHLTGDNKIHNMKSYPYRCFKRKTYCWSYTFDFEYFDKLWFVDVLTYKGIIYYMKLRKDRGEKGEWFGYSSLNLLSYKIN
jgi:hypothetical protein